MDEFELASFLKIHREIGRRIDYVQGGGGNISSKIPSGLMAVKASGFKFKEVSRSDGFVLLDFCSIRDYLEKASIAPDTASDEESQAFIRSAVVGRPGSPDRRPSVEAGFHALLKPHVIHTHPVYVNILACSIEGPRVSERIFSNAGFSRVWLPYLRPGISLSLGVLNAIQRTGETPDVWFIGNHGLIVTAEAPEDVVRIHDQVNGLIMDRLDLKDPFPEIKLEKRGEDRFVSATEFRGERISRIVGGGRLLNDPILYPDQLVYLNAHLLSGLIVPVEGGLEYRTSAAEAESIEETLAGYVYVLETIRSLGWNVKQMEREEIAFIHGWESEAYRRKQASRRP